VLIKTHMNRSNLIPALASILVAGCGQGTTLVLDLTDAPPDVTTLSHVHVSLASVEVHRVDKAERKDGDPNDKSIDNDGNWEEVTADAGTFDLIALQNDATAALGELELPEGKITQIRLFIDPAGRNEVELTTGESCALDLDLGEGEQTGVKINHPFKAIDLPEGEQVRVVVDFDLKESVDQSIAGECAFTLKPVIKLKTTGIE
jgi:hypothetical protein